MPKTKRAKTIAVKKKLSPRCPKCAYRHPIRSGTVQGEQRWKCKACGYQYTRTTPRGRPLWQKSLVVFLYSYGVSLHAIARIFHVQPSTVLKWVRRYAQDRRSPEAGDVNIMAMPDMRRHLKGAGTQDTGILCIAIDNATFKKSLGITITER